MSRLANPQNRKVGDDRERGGDRGEEGGECDAGGGSDDSEQRVDGLAVSTVDRSRKPPPSFCGQILPAVP
jgi:hypothetical protein